MAKETARLRMLAALARDYEVEARELTAARINQDRTLGSATDTVQKDLRKKYNLDGRGN